MKKGLQPALHVLGSSRRGEGTSDVARVLRRAGQLNRLSQAVQARLPAALAPHVRVANARGDRIVMIAASAAWATRLRYHPTAFLRGLYSPEGQALKRVEVKVRPLGRESLPRRQPNRPSPGAAKAMAAIAADIEDEELSQALLRLAAAAR